MGCPAYAIPETLNSEKFPATTCSSIIENYSAAPDGPYWFRHPVTGAVERKWCLFGDGLGPRFDMGRTEITFVTPAGYNTGLTPMSFGSSIDYWTRNVTPPMMMRYEMVSSYRGWGSGQPFVATDAFPPRSWAEGALGLLNYNVGIIQFTAEAPVVVRMYNVESFTKISNWHTTITSKGWLWRQDLNWCDVWGCDFVADGRYWRVYEQFFFAGTHELDTTEAAYQFFTPADGTLPGSDQPAELESAFAAQPPPTTYRTPRVNVSALGYAAGLTPYDFGGSVDLWTTNLYLRYPKYASDRGWNSFGYIATDADPLPSWSEGALGLLSMDAGTVEFTTDEPVVVRLYNTKQNVQDHNRDNGHYNTDRWNNIDDMRLWRRRNDLAWCNAWKCAPSNQAQYVGSYWVVWERYFPEGTHALDTTQAAYQFFTPANGTLPGSDQPAELKSAAYMNETVRPDYVTPKVNVSALGYAAGLTPYDFGGSVDLWTTNLYLRYPKYASDRGWNSFGYIATDADPLPSWSEGALGLLSMDVGTVEFTTDEPVVVRLYNTKQNVQDRNRDNGHYNTDRWNYIDDMMLWRRRNDLAWCNAWKCAPRNEAHIVGSYWVVWERYFPEGTHALDTTQAAYQFFTPANGTLPGSDQPAELKSAAYMNETVRPDYVTPKVNVSALGYAAGLTPYDFGGSVDLWTTNLYLRYPKYASDRGWNSFGYIATDADPLPSWSEGALGLLSMDAGTVEFTTDEPVVVRLYNTKQNVQDHNRDDGHYNTDRWNNIDDMRLWRRRNDLAWCNAWKCAPSNQAHIVGSYWVVWERYFPKGTHALDTTMAAYQFFTPANGLCREATSPPSSSRLRTWMRRRDRTTRRRR
jgi:predicted metal-binding protein